MLVVVAASCGGGDEPAGDPLNGTGWELTSVWDGTLMVAANPTTTATIVFTDGLTSGSTGCNRYQTVYSVDAASISFGEPVLTVSACDPRYTAQGTAVIRAVQASEGFAVGPDSLELTDASGAVVLRFRPANELLLIEVSWQLARFGEGTSPLDGTQISLAFRSDGTLLGVAGCNDYGADYQVEGEQLVIGSIAHTETACKEPDGVMAQEADYLAVIQRVGAYASTMTGLVLLDEDGTALAEFRFAGRIR